MNRDFLTGRYIFNPLDNAKLRFSFFLSPETGNTIRTCNSLFKPNRYGNREEWGILDHFSNIFHYYGEIPRIILVDKCHTILPERGYYINLYLGARPIPVYINFLLKLIELGFMRKLSDSESTSYEFGLL